MVIQVHHIRNGLRMIRRRTVGSTSLRNRFDGLTSKDVMVLSRLRGRLVRSKKRLRVLLIVLATRMRDGDDEDSIVLPLLYVRTVEGIRVLKKSIYKMAFTSQEYRNSHHIL